MIDEQVASLSTTDCFVQQCSHHWVIQDGDGPTSAGVCRLCGELKQFKNYLEASHWGDEKAKNDSRTSLLGRPSKAQAILEDDEDF
jgi:hypothetical protein